jgi:hypothetical protein
MSDNTQGRTDRKLRFAELHLEELRGMSGSRGQDFERAHQEAVLAQMMGAYDAFLGELNGLLKCGRPAEDVSLGKLRDALKKQGRSSRVLRRLYELQKDERSWFRQAQELRHISTHWGNIPLAFYIGGKDSGKVALKHPRTMGEFPDHATETLATWLRNMKALVDELRQMALREAEG